MPAAADKTAEASSDAPATPVTLTARAAEKVNQIRVEEKIQDGYALRLKVLGGGCSGFAYDLYFDQQQDIDQAFECNGVKMLCDQMSLMYLMGTEIDYLESLQGSGFKFSNPNVKSTCGCGSSFSV
ncbi:MAG TPA: iron-sulfur cluster insertion protein ErpA [Polyangia bacterium]|jgi:iron-sulfur cluster assembly accessory protein|nr:iron-sulfur cluster insertion protein ErpA [Polyangia bacterium]